MKKLLIILALCSSSCFFYTHHIKQANHAICTYDGSISYQIDHVSKVTQINDVPVIYELTYNDNSVEQFYGSCYIPK